MRSRKFFTAAAITLGVALSTTACGGGDTVTANGRPVSTTATTVVTQPAPTERYTDPTTTESTTTRTSLYDPPPPPAPKTVKNDLPKYTVGDELGFTSSTIKLALTEAIKVDSRAEPNRPVKLVRRDQKLTCKGLNQPLDGSDPNAEPVVWCPGFGDFYVKTAAMEAAGSASSLKASYAVLYGAADYLLLRNQLSNRPGYRDCMVGYLAGRLEIAGIIDPIVARTQLQQYAGDPSFYGQGYQNGKGACAA